MTKTSNWSNSKLQALGHFYDPNTACSLQLTICHCIIYLSQVDRSHLALVLNEFIRGHPSLSMFIQLYKTYTF